MVTLLMSVDLTACHGDIIDVSGPRDPSWLHYCLPMMAYPPPPPPYVPMMAYPVALVTCYVTLVKSVVLVICRGDVTDISRKHEVHRGLSQCPEDLSLIHI